MARTMFLFFTIFLFLLIFPFQLTMAQGPGAPPAPPPPPAPSAPAPAPPAPSAPAPAPPAPSAPAPPPPAPGTPPTTGTPPTPGTKTPGICNVNDYTPGVSAQLNQIRTKTSAGAPVTISGTVSYLNGCTFLVTGFSYYFAATGSYWFGSNFTDPNAPSFLVSNTPIGQFQSQTVNFTLKPDVTFDYFNVLNLYSVDEHAVYAQAVLKTPPTPPSPPSGSSTNPKSNDATRLSMDQNMMNKIIFGVFVALFPFI